MINDIKNIFIYFLVYNYFANHVLCEQRRVL
jgi:hypothetical protein